MSYDASQYNDQRPNVGVTVVPFIYDDGVIKTLVYRRPMDAEEFAGQLALPNCFYNRQQHGCAEDAADEALSFKTNVAVPYVEQLHTFSGDYIDPNRINTVNVCFFALLRKTDIQVLGDARYETRWVSVEDLLKVDVFAFNHFEVLEMAWARIKAKAEYTELSTYLLEPKFTIPDLKALTELLLGIELNNSRFRDRLVKSELLVACDGEYRSGGAVRPSQLYRLNPDYDGNFFPRSLTKAK